MTSFILVGTLPFGGPREASLADISGDGRVLTYIDKHPDTPGGELLSHLYVASGPNLSPTPVASYPVASAGFSSIGIDGGVLSNNGRYVFYSTGVIGAGTIGGVRNSIYVDDLQSAAPPLDITPFFDPFPLPNQPFPAYQGLLPAG